MLLEHNEMYSLFLVVADGSYLINKENKLCKKSLKIPKGQSESVYRKEEQTTQWPKEKVQKDKQRSTKHTYKTKD